LTRLRKWDWGMRQSARLPTWAQVAFGVFLAWPCVVVPRWRLFLGLGALTSAGLSAARGYYGVDELTWGTIAALSTIHLWFPIVVLAPVLLPYTLLAGLLVLVADWHGRRGERPGAEPGTIPDCGGMFGGTGDQ
jgi:hypothetical protein